MAINDNDLLYECIIICSKASALTKKRYKNISIR